MKKFRTTHFTVNYFSTRYYLNSFPYRILLTSASSSGGRCFSKDFSTLSNSPAILLTDNDLHLRNEKEDNSEIRHRTRGDLKVW